jgi:multisubunit Na+/H+ antiporter MnhF subunit
MWLVAAGILLLGLVPCGALAMRADPGTGLTALSAGTVLVALALLVMSVGFRRSVYVDVSVVVSLLTFGGGMVFVQYLERWR